MKGTIDNGLNEIEGAGLMAGVYFLYIEDKSDSEVIKLIKQ